MKVGIIGAGAIGRQVITVLAAGRRADLLLLTRPGRPRPEWLPQAAEAVDDMGAFLAHRPSVVVEAARQEAVGILLPEILASGIPVIICSTGALADRAERQRLTAVADESRSYVVVPGGAIGGLDYIRSAAALPGTRISYTSRKPPAAWHAELRVLGFAPENLSDAVILFEGGADEAARRFPRNLNAALTLMLAADAAPLTVRVLADPRATGNAHEIEVSGPAGCAKMLFANVPSSDNPKTSIITAASVLRALDDILFRRSLRLV